MRSIKFNRENDFTQIPLSKMEAGEFFIRCDSPDATLYLIDETDEEDDYIVYNFSMQDFMPLGHNTLVYPVIPTSITYKACEY